MHMCTVYGTDQDGGREGGREGAEIGSGHTAVSQSVTKALLFHAAPVKSGDKLLLGHSLCHSVTHAP